MYLIPTYMQYIYTFWDTYTYAHAGSLMDMRLLILFLHSFRLQPAVECCLKRGLISALINAPQAGCC